MDSAVQLPRSGALTPLDGHEMHRLSLSTNAVSPALIATIFISIGCSCASSSVPTPNPSAVTTVASGVPPHDSFTVSSRILGEQRLINVHTPAAYETRDSSAHRVRLPVLYMPDGGLNEDFPHVVQAVEALIAKGAIRPVIVVGVPNTERRRDLTGPTRFASDSAIAPHVGGSAAFRQFIRDELIPTIDARYRTTSERSIVGESLAGLFIVETFLREPTSFDHYIALDPSLWWDGGSLLGFASTHLPSAELQRRTLYLASSNVEDISTPTARLDSILRTVRPQGFSWVYVPRTDLTHGTIFRGLESEALTHALK